MENETKEEAKPDLIDLFDKAPAKQKDTWPDWYKANTEDVMERLKVMPNIAAIPTDISNHALHIGLLFLHRGGHPLWNKLSQDNKDDIEGLIQPLTQIFQQQQDTGIYGKFYSRATSAR